MLLNALLSAVLFVQPTFLSKSASSAGERLVVWGDSITAYGLGAPTTPACASPAQQQGTSYASLVGVLAGDRIHLVHNAGNPGERTDQILIRFDRDVASYHPTTVLILAGTNDIAQFGKLTLDQTEANLSSMVDAVKKVGAVPIVQTIPPMYTQTARANQELLALNAWIREYAKGKSLPFVDQYNKLVEPTTHSPRTEYTLKVDGSVSYNLHLSSPKQFGTTKIQPHPANNQVIDADTAPIQPKATADEVAKTLNATPGLPPDSFAVTGPTGGPYTVLSLTGYPLQLSASQTAQHQVTISEGDQFFWDGRHPSIQGQIVMANAAASEIRTYFPTISDIRQGRANLLSDGDFSHGPSGNEWAYLPAKFSYSQNRSFDRSNEGINWLSARSLGSNGTVVKQMVKSGFSPGDTLAFAGRFQVEGAQISGGNYSIGMTTNAGTRYWCAHNWSYDIPKGYFYQEMVVPESTTSIDCVLFTNGAGVTYRVADFALVNLSR